MQRQGARACGYDDGGFAQRVDQDGPEAEGNGDAYSQVSFPTRVGPVCPAGILTWPFRRVVSHWTTAFLPTNDSWWRCRARLTRLLLAAGLVLSVTKQRPAGRSG